ncbi:MAG: sensor domain-containing diguanylate cyclase [Candidatus Omnitrophica bacterium]|nr:sensor domain-containing diguanylate cyclase [Candidatus Omnitrophota bacterium]
MVTAISAFNAPILLAWVGFGVVGGVSMTLISFLLVLLLDFRMGFCGYHIFAAPFFLTAFLGYLFCREKHRLDQLYVLKSEKLDEEINILLEEIKQRNKTIKSFEEKLARYSMLKEVAESFSTVLSLEDIGSLIIKKVLSTIGKAGRVLLFLVDMERQELMLSSSSTQDEAVIKTKKGDIFDLWVLRHRKSLIIEDVARDFRFPVSEADAARTTFRSLIATPLVSENKIIGILRMDSPMELAYTQDDLRLLDIIANLGAVAVENAYLYARTQELAIRDSLTGLKVRRFFMESLHREIKRASRKREKLSLLMLDIDHFKEYNDKFGHTAGDLILKHLAKSISAYVHEDDVVGRYGGEEIAILLYGRGREEAAAEADKIRALIKEKPLTLRREEASLTVSIGVSTYPDDALSEEEMIRVADMRLYKAKSQGRDQVCSN